MDADLDVIAYLVWSEGGGESVGGADGLVVYGDDDISTMEMSVGGSSTGEDVGDEDAVVRALWVNLDTEGGITEIESIVACFTFGEPESPGALCVFEGLVEGVFEGKTTGGVFIEMSGVGVIPGLKFS